MKHLIDKDALVAKIENRIKELQNLHKESEEKLDSIQKTAILLCIDECKVILSSLNTLEVKEVDFEKEIRDFMQLYHLHIKDGGRIVFENNDSPNFMCDMRSIAKYFFELGLKAQKGEEV